MALYSPVIRAQENLARTLRGGLGALGDRPLATAKLGLEEAALRHNIGRQSRLDELAEPGLRLQAENAQAELARLNAPVNIRDGLKLIYGDNPDPETVGHTVANGHLTEAMKASGVTVKDGLIYKKDGTPVTGRDLPRFKTIMQIMLGSGVDKGHALNQQIEKLELIGNRTPEQEAILTQIKKQRNDPNWLIRKYEEQNQRDQQAKGYLEQIGIRDFSFIDSNIARRDRKIERLRDREAKRQERLAEKSDKDTRSTFQKDAEFLASVNEGMTVTEAADILRADKTMSERLRAAAAEIEKIDEYAEEDIKAQRIEAIRKKYALNVEPEYRGLPRKKKKKTAINDPDEIRLLLFD